MSETLALSWAQLQDLDERVAALMEPMPAPVSARTLRESEPDFVWCNYYYVKSEGGWWQANIGTDHGPAEDDDKPVRWAPAEAICGDDDWTGAARVWEAVSSAWQLHLTNLVDGWVCSIRPLGPLGYAAGHQVAAETGPQAICLAVVEALTTAPASPAAP